MSVQTELMDFFNLFYQIKTWTMMLNDDRCKYMMEIMSKMETIKDIMIICFDIYNTYQLKNGNYVRGERIFTIEVNVTEDIFTAYEYSFCKHKGHLRDFRDVLLTEHSLRDVFDIIMTFEKNILPKIKNFEQETYEMHLIKYGY